MFCGGIGAGPRPSPVPFGPKIYETASRLFWNEAQLSKGKVSTGFSAPNAGTVMTMSIKKDLSCDNYSVYDEDALVCDPAHVEEAPWMASVYVNANYKNPQISYQIPFCYGSSIYRLHASPDGTSYLLSADGKTKLAEINRYGFVRLDESSVIPQSHLPVVAYSVHTFLGIKNPDRDEHAYPLNYCGNRKWWGFQSCDKV